jgi:Mn-dependent DtxR family transcriptional regulator
MTSKEKLIVKHLGYTTFALYYYIKATPKFDNKTMEQELGLSKQSRFRALRDLKEKNIITIKQRSNRTFTVLGEESWTL